MRLAPKTPPSKEELMSRNNHYFLFLSFVPAAMFAIFLGICLASLACTYIILPQLSYFFKERHRKKLARLHFQRRKTFKPSGPPLLMQILREEKQNLSGQTTGQDPGRGDGARAEGHSQQLREPGGRALIRGMFERSRDKQSLLPHH